MGYFQCVFLIVLLASYVCGEINEDNEDSNVLERMMWRQATDVGELLADVKALIMGQEHQMQQQQEFQQQMIQQQQEFPQQIRRETQPLREKLQQLQQQQQEFPQQIRRETQPLKEKLQQMHQQQEFQQQQRNQRCKTTERGRQYTGTLAVTRSGKTCLRWDSVGYPYTASYFREATLAAAANYCRNPDNYYYRGPWCYFTDSHGRRSQEYCDVPLCL